MARHPYVEGWKPRFDRHPPQSSRQFMSLTARSALLLAALAVTGCAHLGLLRPNTLKQLNTPGRPPGKRVPRVDNPNEDIVGRLFAHGGLAHAERGEDGIMRARIRVPPNQFIWEPAIIVMPESGELEVMLQKEPPG